ncbi:MAG: amidohydrolase [Bacteroidia bacterium]|nr:amidohydrolase [Bacteroidia bacterium]NNF32270.1 amidohydrolase [Flavobacteriaceae bacterium]MBT8276912.1 amidohydrolase [Bacteroidia bacterium]NNJ83307.1 amidohydrolase [Flavobacteriaceae bacterium]NNK53771.1 amidohydrolase [Flavobacteriaceae bacterium]
MKKLVLLSLLPLFCITLSCSSEWIPVDLLVQNATVYTVDETFSTVDGFVIKDGKILETGNVEQLVSKYNPSEIYDAGGKTIFPGLIDAHAHLYGLGNSLQIVDLVGTQSYDEVLERVVSFQQEKNVDFIEGRGWDQNDWELKEFPTKDKLDSLFPDTPVVLRRIDGHALLANTKALDLGGVTPETSMDGGEVIVKDGELTGILVDAPMSLVYTNAPEVSVETAARSLVEAEEICLSLGLTTVNDAGLPRKVIEMIDSLQRRDEMKLRVYAMVANFEENLDYYLNKGIIKTDRLNVRSVKVYADGALGSRGAAMKAPYSDQPGHYGAMITTEAQMDSLAKRIADAGYQMNTHAIGDSANVAVLRAYSRVLEGKTDTRWKVEHAQVVSISDFDYFSKNIIPSIQPTHATSDMYWAEDRVGPDRIKGAYAYKTLLNKAGIVALGTDFPVEKVNPMHTFYAAVARKDLENYPDGGYRMEEALSREEALRGMTIWAAYSNFEEMEKGSIEDGKFADFVVLDQDIMKVHEDSIPNVRVLATFVNGELVYGN